MNADILLGAHLSTSGGLEQAIFTGQQIGCTAIQIFTHSNRQWAIKSLDEDTIKKFDHARKQTRIRDIVVHASYLINLASPNPQTRTLSIKTLIKELELCQSLTIQKLILHPGSSIVAPTQESCAAVAQALDEAFSAQKNNVMILLETMAGQGSSIGSTLEELATIRSMSRYPHRIGICLDTCHIHAAGYHILDQINYELFWKKFDALLGIENLQAIHLNDSKTAQGSRVDRHAHIGMGTMGLIPFSLIMNDPQLVHIPKIIETPKEDSLEADIKNLKVLKNLLK